MATALSIFKKAGLENLVSPALIGAGIGGLGYGASSFFGDKDPNKSTKDKLTGALGDAAKGIALGGLAGAGVGGATELYHNLFSKPENIQNLVAGSKEKLDTSPYPVHHPFGALFGNLGHSDSKIQDAITGGAVGATAGATKEHLTRSAGKLQADSALGGLLSKKPEARTFPNDNALEAASDLGKHRGAIQSDNKSLVSMLSGIKNKSMDTPQSREAAIAHLMKTMPHDVAANGPMPTDEHRLSMLKSRAESLLTADKTHSTPDAISQASSRIVNSLEHPFASGFKGYSGAALKGGASGAALLPILRAVIGKAQDASLNLSYSPEQLKLWNQLQNK